MFHEEGLQAFISNCLQASVFLDFIKSGGCFVQANL